MSKRRPNGDGMVRKRPDGRWEARIIVGHKENGKPIYKSVFGKTQSEAMTKFYKLLETYRGVELNEDCLVNLNEWLDRWLCYQKDVVRPQTLNKYIFYADAYVRPYLGYKKISAILTRDMQQLYVKLLKEGRVTESKTKGKSLSGSTVRAVHIYEEIARLLIQAKEEGFYELILLGLATGMRRGELLGLKWDDINFTTGELSIKREYTTLGSDYIISTPKTKSSVRSVYLPQSVLNILGEYRETVSSEWVSRRHSIRRIRAVRRVVAVGCRVCWSAPDAIIFRFTVCGISSQPWHWKTGLTSKRCLQSSVILRQRRPSAYILT